MVTITGLQMAYAAIAHNCGSSVPAKGLKQGFKGETRKYYGKLVA